MSEMMLKNVQGAAAMNPVHIVTAKDVAAKSGYSVNSVHSVFSKNVISTCSPVMIARVMDAARELGYDPKGVRAKAYSNRIKNLASRECSNCKKVYVPTGYRQLYCPDCGIAKENERKLVAARRTYEKKKMEKFWYNGNFHTKAEEVRRMKELRAEGFSNAEIAKKIGRTSKTVLRSIGCQSEDMTKMNVAQGQKNRAARNNQRRVYVATHTVNVFNKLVTAMEETDQQMRNIHLTRVRIAKQLADLEEEVKKAAPLSEVKPAEYTHMTVEQLVGIAQ